MSSTRPSHLLCCLLLAGALVPTAASGQRPLVSANPHAASLPSGTPPLSGIAAIPCTSANAYHVSSTTEVNRALGYPDYGKPKILSDDANNITVSQTTSWIQSVCNANATHNNHAVHYEHFDSGLSGSADAGDIINAVNDFPMATSRAVLEYIRDESCASDLSAGGTLTRSGNEFLWNGQGVNLIGHSWMGAVAGLNFNTEQYLSVLASYDVNLTRIWVIEQWTGLEVAGSPPVYSNSILPFTGSIANDSVDLDQFNSAYLNRIEDFVQRAWNKGIVVQITLFDRHGLLNNPGEWGRWDGSPYNPANTTDHVFTPGAVAVGSSNGGAPTNFLDLCQPTYTQAATTCPVQKTHFNFIKALRNRLQTKRNVIFEIMNEPLAGEWGTTPITDFHKWVADATIRNGIEKVSFGCFN
ncbi:MAG: cellulase family glycosylhydrolase [Acidobacteria bacterium]|nr:cellulase family glycosylhydrolase [Acidobacteriota bacterium]